MAWVSVGAEDSGWWILTSRDSSSATFWPTAFFGPENSWGWGRGRAGQNARELNPQRFGASRCLWVGLVFIHSLTHVRTHACTEGQHVCSCHSYSQPTLTRGLLLCASD